MDVNKGIRLAVDTGKVYMGYKETEKAVVDRDAKLVIISSNIPGEKEEELEKLASLSDIAVYRYQGSSMVLGAVCGRPHLVSALGVAKAGDSDIFELGRRKK